jgi:transcription-repair coupling factor (superfamily II helicase)
MEDEAPALSKLGGKAWDRTKNKIKESIKAHAKELLKIYAARQTLDGFAYAPRDDYYREFEARFEFEETPDQGSAIEDVLGGMENARPMDRLVCGDTGYGKTEVALRAAFKAVTENKQVGILVPTTVLAHQHYQTFSRRYRDFPVVVAMLSRFQTRREQEKIVRETREGIVDILIGTHRLLQKDVKFKDVGLIIIDEEHRFGVRHKEKLKRFRELVDVLTLTATPIPRTLQLSLLGIRDLSIINSPPENRLSIKTFITRYDEKIIREAVIREFMRDGQVFFVHNRVERIDAVAATIQKIVPEARLAIAHGQMNERELEAVMWAFHQREVNLLVCTSIIESGLDFPSANTIIINRADRMGLAQLYQLRGRVGRSSHQAYAYFLIPGMKHLTTKAKKRLQALTEFSELGSGFRLANYDLEIRGGGNILGLSQSGHMNQVGVELYYELIERAVKEIRGDKVLLGVEPEIKVPIPAYIPEEYVPDIHQRLQIYKRLAGGLEEAGIVDVHNELQDRFGLVPEEVENLLLISSVKPVLKEHMITSLEFARGHIVLAFHPEAEKSLEKVLVLLERNGESLRFTPDHRLYIPFEDGQQWSAMVKKVCETLQ